MTTCAHVNVGQYIISNNDWETSQFIETNHNNTTWVVVKVYCLLLKYVKAQTKYWLFNKIIISEIILLIKICL